MNGSERGKAGGMPYTLYVDDSQDSSTAIEELTRAGYVFDVVHVANGRTLPSVETGSGSCDGLNEIRSYLIPDETWPKRKARIERLMARVAEARAAHA